MLSFISTIAAATKRKINRVDYEREVNERSVKRPRTISPTDVGSLFLIAAGHLSLTSGVARNPMNPRTNGKPAMKGPDATILREAHEVSQQEHSRRVADMGIVDRDFSDSPQHSARERPPLVTSSWSPNAALAEFDMRTVYTNNVVIGDATRPPIMGMTLSRLLQIGWVTLDEARRMCLQKDWDEVRRWRRACLTKAIARSSGSVDEAVDFSASVSDEELGLSMRSRVEKHSRGQVRWDDGEHPWVALWKGFAIKPDSPCMRHVFNTRNDYAGKQEDGVAYQTMKHFKPSHQERILLIPIAQASFSGFDQGWYESHGNL